MVFWDMVFLKDSLPDASTGQSADWQRGRYLAGAAGRRLAASCSAQATASAGRPAARATR